MKFSVLIPAYNAATTVDSAIRSVLAQTHRPLEILALDDGSTDDTYDRLRAYHPQVTVFQTANGGLARARQFLYEQACGEAVACLDADDLWFPGYLEAQQAAFAKHPGAVASFVNFVTFRQSAELPASDAAGAGAGPERCLLPVDFLEQYNRFPALFLPSFCCLQNQALRQLQKAHLREAVGSIRDYDFYIFNLLPLAGPVVVSERQLGAYRLTPGSSSSNRLRGFERTLAVLAQLSTQTYTPQREEFFPVFQAAVAARRRQYARCLMGAGETSKARAQFRMVPRTWRDWRNLVKSFGLYFSTYLPKAVQPTWTGPNRDR